MCGHITFGKTGAWKIEIGRPGQGAPEKDYRLFLEVHAILIMDLLFVYLFVLKDKSYKRQM